jgi:NADH-quinone oxidoreductase subunit L
MPSAPLPFSVLLLMVLPLLAFAGLWMAGKRINAFAGWLAACSTLVGLLISIAFALPQGVYFSTINWITIGTYTLPLSFRLDTLAGMMLVLVHFVAFLVQIYSVAYLHHDPGRNRYFAFLQLFVFSMLGIVLAGNLLVMYIFWELVGLASYLLIGYWYHRPRAAWAAKKAFILNRIGDAAFLTGILLLVYYTGSTDFTELPSLLTPLPAPLLTGIGLCLFGGCIGKSAQFPLSAWLPDAMEGPTPVSALIHAATMVAAGIFLLARIAFLLTPLAQLIVAIIGTITMLRGAWKAMHAWDIKRVLAYSTISQLGLMVLAVGMGSWPTALLHLLTHAFFKAGLFLSAGSVIHAMAPEDLTSPFDAQDMRNMGGLRSLMPRTFVCFVVCGGALAGLPLLSGFLSKDAIFLAAFGKASEMGGLYYLFPSLALLAAGVTAYYMGRQVWLIFMGEKRYRAEPSVHPHESPATMWVPMALLAAGSLFFWFSPNPLAADTGWFMQRLGYEESFHAVWVPLVSVLATVTGLGAAYWQARKPYGFGTSTFMERLSSGRVWSGRPVILAEFGETTHYQAFFLVPFQRIATWCVLLESRVFDAVVNAVARFSVVLAHILGWVDRHITDGGVRGVMYIARGAGQLVRLLQNGKIQSYYVVTFAGVILLLLWILLV